MPDIADRSLNVKTMGADLRIVIVEPGVVAKVLWLIRRAFVAAYEDNCFGIAKGAAYSFLLSLFPVLTILTAVLIQVRAQSVVHVISTFIMQVVPPGTEDLILSRLRGSGNKPVSLSIVATILAVWAGSGAMMSLMEGFQAAYRIPSGRDFFRQRAMAIFLLLIAALPAVGASSLIIFGNRIEAIFLHWMGTGPQDEDIRTPIRLAWQLGRYVVAFGTTVLVTGLLYYFGPNHRPEQKTMREVAASRFLRVWPGAFLATVLWLLATAGFAWYVAHLAHYNVFYGSLGAVVILLIWLYLIACISLIGCEFNAERERIDSVPAVL